LLVPAGGAPAIRPDEDWVSPDVLQTPAHPMHITATAWIRQPLIHPKIVALAQLSYECNPVRLHRQPMLAGAIEGCFCSLGIGANLRGPRW